MAKSKQSFQKSEKEKIKQRKKKEKEEKKAHRKLNSNKGKGFESMIAYVDHKGQFSSTPPDPRLKTELKADDIQLGARIELPSDEPDWVRKGRIAQFNESKGYGFIKDSVTKEQVFFHLSNVKTEIRQGDMVSYEITKGPKGLSAVAVTKIYAI
jgi:cold shock CspA family protein